MAKSVDLDLSFAQNQLLLNPQLPLFEKEQLSQLAQTAFSSLNLNAHVAISTSGSTKQGQSSAKLVFLSKEALQVSAAAVNAHLQVTSADSWVSVLPFFHVGGLGIYLRASLAGIPVVSYEAQKWSPEAFQEVLIGAQSTLTSLVPTQVYDIVKSQIVCPRSLRAVIVGGGGLSEDLWLKARRLGWPLLPSFGMSETCSQIATASLADLNFVQMPLPQLLTHVELQSSPQGILVSSASLLTAYAQIQNGQAVIWDPKDENKNFLLEDRLRLFDNRIEVLGRENDFIKISGESLNLSELRKTFENVLSRHNLDIQEFALMAAPDERLGHQIVMLTTSADELLHQKIKDYFKDLVLPVAKIRKIYVIPEIPRSSLGKVLWSQIHLGDNDEK